MEAKYNGWRRATRARFLLSGCIIDQVRIIDSKMDRGSIHGESVIYSVDVWVRNEASVQKIAVIDVELVAQKAGTVRDRYEKRVILDPGKIEELHFVLTGTKGVEYTHRASIISVK